MTNSDLREKLAQALRDLLSEVYLSLGRCYYEGDQEDEIQALTTAICDLIEAGGKDE